LVGHSLGSRKVEHILADEPKDIKGIVYASPLVDKKNINNNITRKFSKDDPVSKPLTLLTGRFNLSKHSLGNY
jgi:predicted alpha/beta hydrolase family esterase